MHKTKRHRHHRNHRDHLHHGHHHKRVAKVNVMKELDQTPSKYAGRFNPTNMSEAKQRFLQDGTIPSFSFKSEKANSRLKLPKSPKGEIRFDLLKEAKHVLDVVKEKFGDEEAFMLEAYGPKIDHVRGSKLLKKYLKVNKLVGEVPIYWAPDLNCSARMMWHGPNMRLNRPEARKYALIIRNSCDNNFLRETGITCLADHELATHYLRMVNEGMQPWFSDRKKFGLRERRARQEMSSEEGLAAIHTLLNAKSKYLWGPALLYYNSCKAAEMTFMQLFEHLEQYVANPDQRWRHVSRVKKCLLDPDDLGGSGIEQVYFEGAVEILRNIDNIDFKLMYAGKVCVDELTRIKRLARMDCAKTPRFLNDIQQYKKTLRHMAVINGLIPKVKRHSFDSTNTKGQLGCHSRRSSVAAHSKSSRPTRKSTHNPAERKRVDPNVESYMSRFGRSLNDLRRADSLVSSLTSCSSSASLSEDDGEHLADDIMPLGFSQIRAAGLEGSVQSLADMEDTVGISYQREELGGGSLPPSGQAAPQRGLSGEDRLLNRPRSLVNKLKPLKGPRRPQGPERQRGFIERRPAGKSQDA